MSKDLNIDIIKIERIKTIHISLSKSVANNYGPYSLAVGIMITYTNKQSICIITKINNNDFWDVLDRLASKIMVGGIISQRAVIEHLVKSHYNEVKDTFGEAITYADNILINGTPINKQLFIKMVNEHMCATNEE